ncbi:MAG TPA: hypothetical protein VM661_07470 [Candidatus Sulfotelmatobacter sp.]|jgi:hypothetical protein|nr:hypothetical protein [Candidatus Sulfotelmatobacter sp.]
MSIQRTFLAAVAASLFLVLGASAWAGQSYLSEFEDLPLPPGLTEQPGGMLFESPTGRIVEATATGDATAAQIQSFYQQALPQLGWEAQSDGSFRRDNELLRIDIDGGRRPVLVRFSVVPQ